jgi:hypothetical protein
MMIHSEFVMGISAHADLRQTPKLSIWLSAKKLDHNSVAANYPFRKGDYNPNGATFDEDTCLDRCLEH